MNEERSSRRGFLRTVGVFAAAGIGVLATPGTAWASTLCCPHVSTDPCQPGQVWCRGTCGMWCDVDAWGDGQCHRIGCP